MQSLADIAAVLEVAATVTTPVVAFDTCGGSSMARFLVMDADTNQELAEMSRALFNKLRENGHLEEDLEKRYRVHDRCQAWPVIMPTE